MNKKGPSLRIRLRDQWMLQAILLGGLAYLIVFNYIPMTGILISFRKYKISSGIAGFFTSPWVGTKWFEEFLGDYMFPILLRNTIGLSLVKLVFVFPVPIIFALMLNELKAMKFKKLVQTASYLPHFISWIVVSGMLTTFFGSSSGAFNKLLLQAGLIEKPIQILTDPEMYWGLAVFSEIWKEMGWSAIIYIAAISGVDVAQYEAAEIDGASRLRRMWSITLPSISSTIIIMLILQLGSIVNGNFEQAYLLGNAMNYDYSEIVGTYVMNVGLVDRRYDYAAAVGLMQSVVSVILVFGGNLFTRKVFNTGLY